MENNNKTAEGLRDRLFDALDGIINNTIDTQTVESICFVSEQIIKTAKVELEIAVKNHEMYLEKKDREDQAVALLAQTIDATKEMEDIDYDDIA